ncbi:hypothetical protein BpHYR1_040827 [Brachionus plicatilis]|uniref:Uncharacterized protein n=1 Tax=Brachionus plicatilis TaxID=10195 RepID=A0A3M7RZV5_BRAPC|nr:hypothetical protein BpHYR1_040827 [Brachionus plicatilis]
MQRQAQNVVGVLVVEFLHLTLFVVDYAQSGHVIHDLARFVLSSGRFCRFVFDVDSTRRISCFILGLRTLTSSLYTVLS